MMNKVFLLLGSNEGERLSWLQLALEMIVKNIGSIDACSSVYETGAWGIEQQNAFLNVVVAMNTDLNPHELLLGIQQIEKDCGRQRILKWGTRTLDIDILFFNEDIIHEPDLIVPHPFIEQRRFTLVPLNEIANDLIHPIDKKTIGEMLATCQDPLPVTKLAVALKLF